MLDIAASLLLPYPGWPWSLPLDLGVCDAEAPEPCVGEPGCAKEALIAACTSGSSSSSSTSKGGVTDCDCVCDFLLGGSFVNEAPATGADADVLLGSPSGVSSLRTSATASPL